MKKLISLMSRKSGYLVGLVVASMIGGLMSAVALAAIPASDGTVSGCYKNNDGALRVIDPSTSQVCANNETALNWNANGGVKGYAYVGVDQSTTNYYLSSEESNITGFYSASGVSIACLTLNTTPDSIALTAAPGIPNIGTPGGGGSNAYALIKTPSGWQDPTQGAYCDQNLPGSNVMVVNEDVNAGTGFFLTLF